MMASDQPGNAPVRRIIALAVCGIVLILGVPEAGALTAADRRSLNFTVASDGSTASTAERCRQSTAEYQYAVVVDAGSSGSRVNVYRWPSRTAGRVESTPGAVQAIRPSLKIRHGLASVVDNFQQVRVRVARLLRNASGMVPSRLHSYTPVYFMATAGMRRLLEASMNSVMTYIDNLMLDPRVNPFRYDSLSSSRVLSGEEEAVFEWIAVNYLLGNFATGVAADRPLVGIVEMGGASSQLAFRPAGDLMAEMFPVHVTGRQYSLYAHSYLGLGINQVIARVRQVLVARNNRSSTVRHPCMLAGNVREFLGKIFVGDSDPEGCARMLRDHVVYKVKDESRCRPKPCAIGSVYQPSLPGDQQFYAVGGAMVSTLRSIGAVNDDDIFVPRVGFQKATKVCRLSYHEALTQFDEADHKYLTDKCLSAMYMAVLLNHGLGFANDSAVIHVPHNINGQKPGWTLGAVLYENSQIRYECRSAAAAAATAAGGGEDLDDDLPSAPSLHAVRSSGDRNYA